MARGTTDQVLKLGTAANNLTDFTDQVGDVDISMSSTTLQSLGSRKYEQNTTGGVRTFSFSATLGDTAAVSTFLYGKVGTQLFFEHGPVGQSTGDTKISGSIIVNSLQTPSPFQDRRTWTIQGVPASDLTVGTF